MVCLGRARFGQGRTAEAIRILSSVKEWGYLAYVYAKSGRQAEAVLVDLKSVREKVRAERTAAADPAARLASQAETAQAAAVDRARPFSVHPTGPARRRAAATTARPRRAARRSPRSRGGRARWHRSPPRRGSARHGRTDRSARPGPKNIYRNRIRGNAIPIFGIAYDECRVQRERDLLNGRAGEVFGSCVVIRARCSAGSET